MEKVYPIGSIYMSVNSTDPSELFGGEWEAWGSGRVPVGVNTSDDDFLIAEQTGGAKTQDLRALIGAVNGDVGSIGYYASGAVSGMKYNMAIGASAKASIDNVNHSTLVRKVDGDLSSTIQPYITCYMWKRIA